MVEAEHYLLVGEFGFQLKACKLQILILHGEVAPQVFAEVALLHIEVEMGMLQLAVLMESVYQLCNCLRLTAYAVQILPLCVIVDDIVTYSLCIALHDGYGSLDIVGDIRDHLSLLVLKLFPLLLAGF